MLRPLDAPRLPGLLMPAWLAEAAQMLLSSPQALAACAAYAGALVCLLRPRLIDGLFQLDEEDVRRREQESVGALRLIFLVVKPLGICKWLSMGSPFVIIPLVGLIPCLLGKQPPSFRFFDRLILTTALIVTPGTALLQVWFPDLAAALFCPIPDLTGEGRLEGRLARREIFLLNGWALLIQSRVSRQLCVSLAVTTMVLIAFPGLLCTALVATVVFCALMCLKTSEMAQRFSQAMNKAVVAGLVVGLLLALALNAAAICPSLPELSAHQAAQTRHLASAVVFGLALACRRWPGRVDSLLDPTCGQRILQGVQHEHSADAFVYLLLGGTLSAMILHWILGQWPPLIAASLITILLSRMEWTIQKCNRFFHVVYLVLIPIVEATAFDSRGPLLEIAQSIERQWGVYLIDPGAVREELVPLPLVFGPLCATALYTRPAVPLSLMLYVVGVGILADDSVRQTLLKLCLAGLTCIAIVAKGAISQNRAMAQVAHVLRAMQLSRLFDPDPWTSSISNSRQF